MVGWGALCETVGGWASLTVVGSWVGPSVSPSPGTSDYQGLLLMVKDENAKGKPHRTRTLKAYARSHPFTPAAKASHRGEATVSGAERR